MACCLLAVPSCVLLMLLLGLPHLGLQLSRGAAHSARISTNLPASFA